MKHPAKPKLTDAERHARFVETARQVGAEGEAPDFDGTLERLAKQPRDSDGKKREP